ncbi:hypothetical protein HPP92_014652 [Vanilla planifolia]|uniref:Sec1 family domain-containing protein MIP3 n=1 Tax=Vanilla planifolia TaxID=51239 RepID=A0A835UUA7_VANPL|nr:hypothetical protein HPP92_014652 [Vanilla planifolia]
MASIDLVRSCLDSIRQISDEIIDSIIYLDAGCLEALHIVGAFQLFLELGVRAVCSLENMSSLDITANWNSDLLPATKIVVITSHLLSDAHRYILRCLVTHRTILRCIIFTSISEIAHSAYADSPLGPDAFHEYESLLVQDYEELIMSKRSKKCLHNGDTKHAAGGQPYMLSPNDMVDTDPNIEPISSEKDLCHESNSRGIDSFARLQVTVHHYPMILCPVSERVFLLPSEGAVAEARLSNNCEDSLSAGLPLICTGKSSDSDDVPPGVTLSAHFLHNFASVMDLKMEIFSLGDTSKIIGKMLTNMSSLYDVGRRNRRSAGLLLVDRTLDLLTPCCHGDSFLDRVLSSLPRRKRATSCLAMKSSHSLKNNALVNVQHSPLDLRIPFSEMLSKIASDSTSNTLKENIKAFRSGWYASDANSEAADLSDNADKLQDRSHDDELCSFGGCFLCNCTGTNYSEAILTKGVKDGTLLIKKWLMEGLQHEKVPLKGLLGSSVISELNAMVKKLVPDQISLLRNKGILQLALAAETVMSKGHSSRWDAFVSAERILAVSSVDNSQSLLSHIRDLISTSTLGKSFEEDKNDASQLGLLTFKDALLLSVIGYILAGENFQTSESTGPFSWEEEHSLKEVIVDFILENPTIAKLKFLNGLEKELAANAEKEESTKNEDDFDDQWGNWDDEDTSISNDQAYGDMQLKLELRDRIDQLFKLFHKLSGLKWRSSSFIEGLTSPTNYGSDPYARKGLLYKLLATVMAKYEIPGLEYHSSAVGRFFKSGFGRFGLGQGKPCPGDQNVLIVFVVGGINGLEIREAFEAISESSRPDMELIIGGTTLLSSDNMYCFQLNGRQKSVYASS